jgi:DNA-binding transcriptional ArsR family regulator
MGLTKTIDYSKSELAIAKFAKALAHPARVAIIQLLLKKQSCICGDIVDELPIAQSTVSQHLKELKAVGLIKGEIEGTAVCYCLDEQEWKKASSLMLGIFDKIALNNKKCC